MNKDNQKHILLIDCPDRKGLICAVTGVLLEHNFNIISNREFVDQENEYFFMRTKFEGQMKDPAAVISKIKKALPKGANVKIANAGQKKKVVILASHEHHCLAELLIRNAYENVNFQIQAVIANHEKLGDLAEKFGLPFHFISHEDKNRSEHEREILDVLKKYQPDFLVLAKYMRVLSADFVERYENQIINIHHSFLPAFMGANPYLQAHERGVKIIGATAHFVTSELDQGPIIAQEISRINHTFGVATMKKVGQDTEKIVLNRALRMVSEEKVFVYGNKTVVFE